MQIAEPELQNEEIAAARVIPEVPNLIPRLRLQPKKKDNIE